MKPSRNRDRGIVERRKPRSVEELLDQAEARALRRLRGNLRGLRAESIAAMRSPLLRRHPYLTLAAAGLAGAAAAPCLLRLLRSPARAVRLAGLAIPFLRRVRTLVR